MAEALRLGEDPDNYPCPHVMTVSNPYESKWKEAFVCDEWAARHWRNNSGELDFEKPSDRFDFCGLRLPDKKPKITTIITDFEYDPLLVQDREIEYVSTPSERFTNVEHFLNSNGIKPFGFLESNVTLRVISPE